MHLWFWYCQLPSIVLVPTCTSSRNGWAFIFPNTVCCQSNASKITILYNVFFCHVAWLAGSQFFNLGPWQWKSGILTTRLPGNSLLTSFKLLKFSELSVSSFLAYVLCVSFLLSHHVFSFAFSAWQIPSHSLRHNSNIIHEKLFRTLSYTSSLTCCLFSGIL